MNAFHATPRRATRRAAAVAVTTLFVAVALSCGSVPKRYYFSLDYPLEPDAATASRPPLHPFRLRIKPFRVALPYNRAQIVYRQSMFEFQYYSFRLWAAKPQHLLRELVERHLTSARLALEVTREYGEELPDYELSADVLAMEEYDSGDVWYGHLAVRFELVRFSDKMPIWHYQFDRKRRVREKQPVYVVRALSRIVEDELQRVTAQLDAVFARERGVAPTLVAPPTQTEEPPGPDDELLVPPLVGPEPTAPTAPTPPRPDDELIVPDDGPLLPEELEDKP